MENILQTVALLALCNTALIQFIKWVVTQAGGTLQGTALAIFSWIVPFAAAFVLDAMGTIDANVFGCVLWGAVTAATSNKVFDIAAWLKGQWQAYSDM
jgi:hypothetical protein